MPRVPSWKAVAVHGPTSGIGHFDDDAWELFHLAEDYSEAHDLSGEMPDKLKQMIDIWFEEADKFDVLPLDDRRPPEILNDPRPQPEPDRDTYVYFPHTNEVPEAVAPNIRGRSFRIVAEIEVGEGGAEGVVFAHGARFGGHALFFREGRLHYVYNFLGVPPEQVFAAPDKLGPGKHLVGMSFDKDSVGDYGEAHGTTRLYVGEDVVAEGPMRSQVANFTLAGDGLCVGRDSSDAVSELYHPPSAFTGGDIAHVEVVLGDDQYIDIERTAAAMLARE
jgi:hypothetical protein